LNFSQVQNFGKIGMNCKILYAEGYKTLGKELKKMWKIKCLLK